MAKLQVRTEEQKKFIESFNNVACTLMNILDDTVEIDGCISFDEMAEIVDYLRFPNWRNFEQEIAKFEEYNRLLEENRKLFNVCERLKKENETLKEKCKNLPRIATLNKRIHELKEQIKKYERE